MAIEINRICIIGVGMIGGSLSLALKRVRPEIQMVGTGRNVMALERAVELGVLDEYSMNPSDAVRHADIVVLAVPVGATYAVLDTIAPSLSPNTIITDAGSSKLAVIDAVNRVGERYKLNLAAQFVPGHPIAGRENSGVDAAIANLYDQHRVILTPTEQSQAEHIDAIRYMWELAGAHVTDMEPDHHDEVLAATSHLPHVLAYCLVNSLAELEDRRDIFTYAAGGFRDATRIASSDPEMWRDICLTNKAALLEVLDKYQQDLGQLRNLIADGDGRQLEQKFAHARDTRNAALKRMGGSLPAKTK